MEIEWDADLRLDASEQRSDGPVAILTASVMGLLVTMGCCC